MTDTSKSAPSWEVELSDLLKELAQVQADLLQLLDEKRHVMIGDDAEGMAALQLRETEVCDRLEACHRRRAALLERASNAGLPSDTMGNLVKSLPLGEQGDLVKEVEEAAQRSRVLQHLSLTNWVVAQRSLLHVSQLLEIIATGGRLKPTYGEGDSLHSRGALMDQEA